MYYSRWQACLLVCWTYFFDPEDGGDVTPKRRLKLNGLHGVISQKMILFISDICFRFRVFPGCSSWTPLSSAPRVAVPLANMNSWFTKEVCATMETGGICGAWGETWHHSRLRWLDGKGSFPHKVVRIFSSLSWSGWLRIPGIKSVGTWQISIPRYGNSLSARTTSASTWSAYNWGTMEPLVPRFPANDN
jgi:hypothetical protein